MRINPEQRAKRVKLIERIFDGTLPEPDWEKVAKQEILARYSSRLQSLGIVLDAPVVQEAIDNASCLEDGILRTLERSRYPWGDDDHPQTYFVYALNNGLKPYS